MHVRAYACVLFCRAFETHRGSIECEISPPLFPSRHPDAGNCRGRRCTCGTCAATFLHTLLFSRACIVRAGCINSPSRRPFSQEGKLNGPTSDAAALPRRSPRVRAGERFFFFPPPLLPTMRSSENGARSRTDDRMHADDVPSGAESSPVLAIE